MLEVYERLGDHCHGEVYTTVVLSQEQRDRGRLKLTGENGEGESCGIQTSRDFAQ